MMAVFVISAFVHEYVLSFAFGFFYPVLMFLFGGVGCKYTILFLFWCSDPLSSASSCVDFISDLILQWSTFSRAFFFLSQKALLNHNPWKCDFEISNILDILISPVVDPICVRDYAEYAVKRCIKHQPPPLIISDRVIRLAVYSLGWP